MKKLVLTLVMTIATAIVWTGFAEYVTNVRGVQRGNSKLVDIYYDLEASDGDTYTVGVEIEERTIAVTATTFTGDVGEGVSPGTNRHILWDAGTDWPNKKGDVKAIVTATKKSPIISVGKVQLWEGGPYWADKNIGADNPWDYGLYFWWGDTKGHRPSSDGTFSFNFAPDNSAIYTYLKSVSDLQSAGWVTSDGVLSRVHDAAHVKWGESWRMPTYQEVYDLLFNKCDWTWTTMNGVNGYVICGRGTYASNSIFLPAAGEGYGLSCNGGGGCCFYWVSSLRWSYPSDSSISSCLQASPGAGYGLGTFRCYGCPIRPVQGFTN